MTFDLVVRNGRVVEGGRVRDVDIGIEGGRVRVLQRGLAVGAVDIDANGQLVTPGGVDSHVHMGQLSSMGQMTADDFWTGSRSAVFGGTTTVIPFAAQHRGMALGAVVEDALARAAEEMTIDYGLHVIVTDPDVPGFEADLVRAAEQGIVGIKIFLTYDRLRIDGRRTLDLMTIAHRLGLTVMVHAEDDALVGWGRQQAIDDGEMGAMSHVRSHSRAAERAGVATAIALAEESGAVLVLAHLSIPDSVRQVTAARGRGVAVFAETCPHYLVLTEAALEGSMTEAAPFLCSPPLRTAEESSEMLELLAERQIHIAASDHSPHTLGQKLPSGDETTFVEVANGLPGVEVRLPVMVTVAASLAGDNLARFVDVVSTNPARAAGLFPRKGSLTVGSDADLVIWDEAPRTITYSDLHDAVGYTPYEGIAVDGWPETVIAGGEVVVAPGVDRTRQGRGRLVRRSTPATA